MMMAMMVNVMCVFFFFAKLFFWLDFSSEFQECFEQNFEKKFLRNSPTLNNPLGVIEKDFHSKNSIISTKNNQAKHHTRISHFEYHHHRILLLFHHHHYHHYQKPNHFQSIITVESNCTMTYIDTQRHVQRINPSITNTNGAWIFFFTIHFPIVLLCNRFFRRFLNYFHTVFLLLLKWKAQIENGNWKWKYEKDIEGVKWI